jgi:UrcA family protein
MFKQVLIASLAIASFAATSAQAQETRSVKVSVAGIDTRSDSGARIVLQRIKTAASAVCGPMPSDAIDRLEQYGPCVRLVTEQTVAGLHSPSLTALLTTGKAGAHEAKLASAR